MALCLYFDIPLGRLLNVHKCVTLFFYQVHHLQRVLSKKRDPVTQVCFINEYSNTNDAHLVNRHWKV